MRAQSALRIQPSAEPQPALAAAAAWLPVLPPLASLDDPYSRRVALLKRVLPATGLALLLLIAVWPKLAPLWERMRFAFPAIDLRDARELRMLNPHYAGTDRQGRPYVVTAAVGRQVPDRQDLMSLEAPHADLKTHSGANITVTAATGVYQSAAQLLDLFGDVVVVHQNGTRFVTDTARVDAANNTAEGTDPIEGHGPSGDIKAAGFRILDKGDTIIFTGQSDLLLRGAKPATEAAPAPPALPAAVAAVAVETQTAAKPLLAEARAKAPAAQHAVLRTDSARPTRNAHNTPAHGKPAAVKKS